MQEEENNKIFEVIGHALQRMSVSISLVGIETLIQLLQEDEEKHLWRTRSYDFSYTLIEILCTIGTPEALRAVKDFSQSVIQTFQGAEHQSVYARAKYMLRHIVTQTFHGINSTTATRLTPEGQRRIHVVAKDIVSTLIQLLKGESEIVPNRVAEVLVELGRQDKTYRGVKKVIPVLRSAKEEDPDKFVRLRAEKVLERIQP